MVKSTCIKNNFISLEKINENTTIIRFTKLPMYRYVYDEKENKEIEIESDFVKYTEDVIFGEVNINKILSSRLNDLKEYDKSSEVNEFYYQGDSLWLDRDTRSSLMLRLNAEKLAGKEKSTLWYNDKSYEITPDEGIAMLNQLELYASACYDLTAQHKVNLQAIDNVEDLLAYDITTGYPLKINFDQILVAGSESA